MRRMIAIIDYGAGNLRSVANVLVRLGYQPLVTNNPGKILDAAAVILPGVGAAGDAMDSLRGLSLTEVVQRIVREERPLFAVCVGMQILLSATEEGSWRGCLGIIPGTAKRLPSELKTRRTQTECLEQVHGD